MDGLIFCQLWHVGRVSHPDFHNGNLPVAPSAIVFKGQSFTPNGPKDVVTPMAPEGSINTTRTTIIEFPSKEAAMKWYHSDDYADVKHLRQEATTNGSLIFLEAWQKPQIKESN